MHVIEHLDPSQDVVTSGRGIQQFVLGDFANVAKLSFPPRVAGGMSPGTWLSTETVSASIVDASDGTRVAGNVSIVKESGEFELHYTVTSSAVTAVLLHISVCGQVVQGSPFLVKRGVVLIGSIRASFPLSIHGCVGIALSSDDQLLALADRESCTVTICDARTGTTRSCIGSPGFEAGQFLRPCAICMLPLNGNLLIAEDVSKRVQEVTFTGDHVRFIGVDVLRASEDIITDLSASQTTIAVAVKGANTNYVLLFEATTGRLLSSVQLASKMTAGVFDAASLSVHLSGHGETLYVARGSNSIEVWSVNSGEIPRQMPTLSSAFIFSATDIDTLPTGEVVVVDRLMSNVSFYAPDSATKLGGVAWQALHKPRPWRITTSRLGDAVYVLDRSVGVVVLV